MTRSRVVRQAIAASLLVLAAAAPGCSPLEERSEPTNRVVIVVDASGSYRNRWEAALETVLRMLDEMAQVELKRWEPASDRIVLISLDALPGVLWQGTLADLKTSGKEEWEALFGSRADYRFCTDVSAAFRLAAKHLEGDLRYVRKHLFVFSDLVDEPPTTSIGRCAAVQRPAAPPESFPWDALRDTQTRVFWLPPNQKLVWQRALLEHGLGDSVELYSVSESATSAALRATPPPRATLELTDEERAAARERYRGIAVWLAKGSAAGAGGILCSVFALGFLVRRRARSARRAAVPHGRDPRAGREV